jgi:hypothetical protein
MVQIINLFKLKMFRFNREKLKKKEGRKKQNRLEKTIKRYNREILSLGGHTHIYADARASPTTSRNKRDIVLAPKTAMP